MVPFLDRQAPEYVGSALAEHGKVVFETLNVPAGWFTTKSGRGAEPVVISVVKNEHDRVGDFLRHYRECGIERFFFIDNGSTDGTVEYLCSQADCRVHRIAGPFEWRRKQGWIMSAIDMIGRGRDSWYVYVDADEHIVFDGMERSSFGDLTRRMPARGLTRVRGMLVDMYREGTLLNSSYRPGERLIDSYPFFDGSGYREAVFRQIVSRKGGPRQRVFGPADADFRPELTKYPLFKLSGHDVFANPHHIWPYEDNFSSPCYLGILHFKFLPDTISRIAESIKAENYWGGSLEYKCYHKVLSAEPDLSLWSGQSVRYDSVLQLIEHGLIERLESL